MMTGTLELHWLCELTVPMTGMVEKMRLNAIRLFVLVLSSILLSTNTFAGWSIYKQIQVRASDKNHFRMDAVNGKKIRAWFILGTKTSGAFQKSFPLYQVDQNPVRDLNAIKGVEANKNADHWLRWPISDNFDPPGELLREIFEGKEITVQYYLPDGMIKESTIELKGIKQAIKELEVACSRRE
jgi:hypothetical protein